MRKIGAKPLEAGKIKMEKKYIDLHLHTRYSDGQLNPEQVVELEAQKGIDIMAITDHDNLRGYFKAKKAAEEYGVMLIPGVEITTPNYHLLAYNFDPENEKFWEFMEYSRELQRTGCEARVNKLRDLGMPITIEKIAKEFPKGRLGKGNIRNTFQRDEECRNYLKEKHPELDPTDIFFHYLGKEGLISNLEPKRGIDPYEAIKNVHEAGGVIGIAHPPKDVKDMKELEILVMQGIDFLEVQPNLKPKYPYQEFEDFAKDHNLPVSYGSDYHGPTMARELLEHGENILTGGMAKLLKIAQ